MDAMNQFKRREDGQIHLLTESSLSRIWSYVEGGKPLAFISAFTRQPDTMSPEEALTANHTRNAELTKDIRALGYGFIPFESQYRYDDTGEMGKEFSYGIPGIRKSQAINLGAKYDQESILYCGPEGLQVVATNGTVLQNFRFKAGKENMVFNQNAIRQAFSKLARGTKAAQTPFSFQTESVTELVTKNPAVWSVMAGGSAYHQIRWV